MVYQSQALKSPSHQARALNSHQSVALTCCPLIRTGWTAINSLTLIIIPVFSSTHICSFISGFVRDPLKRVAINLFPSSISKVILYPFLNTNKYFIVIPFRSFLSMSRLNQPRIPSACAKGLNGRFVIFQPFSPYHSRKPLTSIGYTIVRLFLKVANQVFPCHSFLPLGLLFSNFQNNCIYHCPRNFKCSRREVYDFIFIIPNFFPKIQGFLIFSECYTNRHNSN